MELNGGFPTNVVNTRNLILIMLPPLNEYLTGALAVLMKCNSLLTSVERNRQSGRFLLTGSANILLLPRDMILRGLLRMDYSVYSAR